MAIYKPRRKYYKYSLKSWTQPKLTSETSYGKVTASGYRSSSQSPYRALDGVKSGGGDSALGWILRESSGWWKWELPVKLSISSIKYYNTYASASSAVTGQFFIDEGVTPLTNSFSTSSGNWASYTLPSVNTSLTNVIYFKKTAGNDFSGIGELEITAQEQVIVEGTEEDHDYSVVEADKIQDVYSLKQNTNCLLSIPQDIKLSLSNGVLTLKAGSKVYIPNGKNADGSLKFDVVVIESDLVFSGVTSTERHCMLFITQSKTYGWVNITDTYSGTDTNTKARTMCYRTDLNRVIFQNNTTSVNYSLPICIFKYSSNVTSIDQIFNGIGYIGSTLYTLPGVKGLIPDGKNPDGSLKNVEFVTDKVIVKTIGNKSSTLPLFINNKSIEPMLYWLPIGDEGKTYSVWYDKTTNYNYWRQADTSVVKGVWGATPCQNYIQTDANAKITTMTPAIVEDYTKKARIVAAYKGSQLVYNLKYNLKTSADYAKYGKVTNTNRFGTDTGTVSTTSLNQTCTYTFNTPAPSGKWTGSFQYYSQVNFNMSQVYWQLTYEDGTKEYAYGPKSLEDTAYGDGGRSTVSISFTAKKPVKTVTVYATGSGSGNGCYGGYEYIQMFFDGSKQ